MMGSRRVARRTARRKRRIERKVGDLFAHRYLFVQRQLTASEREMLQRITRGLPQLRRLRALMEDVYRLFDRRCRTATAVAKLAVLRARLRRFGRLREVLRALGNRHSRAGRSRRPARSASKSVWCWAAWAGADTRMAAGAGPGR